MNVMRDTATDSFAAGRTLKNTAKSALEKRGKPQQPRGRGVDGLARLQAPADVCQHVVLELPY
jgi:hypothetical protein